MAITRSFSNVFEIQDYTPEILMIPNQWGAVYCLHVHVIAMTVPVVHLLALVPVPEAVNPQHLQLRASLCL